tara:strand:- start:1037 stop:1402 length:366 start_codon:yes stop_codon:yes gene_type:complete
MVRISDLSNSQNSLFRLNGYNHKFYGMMILKWKVSIIITSFWVLYLYIGKTTDCPLENRNCESEYREYYLSDKPIPDKFFPHSLWKNEYNFYVELFVMHIVSVFFGMWIKSEEIRNIMKIS